MGKKDEKKVEVLQFFSATQTFQKAQIPEWENKNEGNKSQFGGRCYFAKNIVGIIGGDFIIVEQHFYFAAIKLGVGGGVFDELAGALRHVGGLRVLFPDPRRQVGVLQVPA